MRWSYSAVGCYYQCPLKFKLRYVEKIDVPQVKHPAMMRGTEIHAMFEKVVAGEDITLPLEFGYYRPFLDNLAQHGAKPEHTILLTRDWTPVTPVQDNIWIKAILDAHMIVDKTAYNYDWKTGGIYDDHTAQRELYCIMQLCEDPTLEESVGTHVYIDKRQNRSTKVTRDDLPELRQKWEDKVRPLYEDTMMVANPGWHCRSCEFSRSSGGPCRF